MRLAAAASPAFAAKPREGRRSRHGSSGTALKRTGRGLKCILTLGNLFCGFLAISYTSDAVLLDGFFSLIGFAVGLVSLRVASLVRRPDDDLYHFGYAAYEPMLNLTKGLLMAFVTLFALVSAILVVIEGGREIEAEWASIYAWIAAAGCFAIAVSQRALAKKTSSPLLSVDSKNWLIDGLMSVAVARADEFLHGNPYAVGALLPLSGRGREVGRQLLQGMQLAQLDEGGPELVVEDTGGDTTKTRAAMDTLVGDRGVIAVLGPVGTRTTEAAAEGARRSGVPLLSFSTSDSVTSAGNQVFRLMYSPRDELGALVRSARSRGLSRFIILYPNHGYGRTMERLFDQEVAAAGGVACGVHPAHDCSFLLSG